MKPLQSIFLGIIEIAILLLVTFIFAHVLISFDLARANPADPHVPQAEHKVEKTKKKKQTDPQPPQSIYFVDWTVPEFEVLLQPILGVLYESTSVSLANGAVPQADEPAESQTNPPEELVNTLTGELGMRVGFANIAFPGKSVRFTLSPQVGYAYGKRINLESSPQVAEGSFQRVLLGNTARLYARFFRYSLGLQFGRIFGDATVVLPMNQAEVLQDFGIKTTASSSVHVTFTIGRSFESVLQDFLVQNSDIWLHLLIIPLHALTLDLGPGQGFIRYPEPRSSFSNTYFKLNADWGIFGDFGLAAGARYVFVVQRQSPVETGFNQNSDSSQVVSREPFRDLGQAARKPIYNEDDATVFFFAGFRRLFSTISVGYLSNYEFVNTLERNAKRQKQLTQGLGVYTQLEL